mmetsp:Transcript_36759/g.95185  ORF Transcript_36759/g.95185 Transcript_36759/m.95185 type:complete len:135 (+) Transcript_36759:29-433(+)
MRINDVEEEAAGGNGSAICSLGLLGSAWEKTGEEIEEIGVRIGRTLCNLPGHRRLFCRDTMHLRELNAESDLGRAAACLSSPSIPHQPFDYSLVRTVARDFGVFVGKEYRPVLMPSIDESHFRWFSCHRSSNAL